MVTIRWGSGAARASDRIPSLDLSVVCGRSVARCGLSGDLFGALRVKIRDESVVKNKAVHLRWRSIAGSGACLGAVDRAKRRRLVRAACHERAQDPRRGRYHQRRDC